MRLEGLIDYDDLSKLSEKEKMNKIGGYWALKDLNGKDYSSLKLSGSYYVLYFGFSLCPDVCPLSLMKMNKAVRKIKDSNEGKQYFRVKTVFVTVNPEYDTPDKLKEFRDLFDTNMIALRAESSSSDYLMDMLRKFKVPVGLNDDEREKVDEYFKSKEKKKSRISRLFGRK